MAMTVEKYEQRIHELNIMEANKIRDDFRRALQSHFDTVQAKTDEMIRGRWVDDGERMG